MTISSTDLRILEILQVDARLTNVELADRIGMAPSPCLRRVKQLERDGIIDRYVAILDRKKVGVGIEAFIQVKVPQQQLDQFQAAIAREPAIVACYIMTGEFDFLLRVVASDMDQFSRFSVSKLLRLPGAHDSRSSFVLSVLKETTAVPVLS